MAVSITSNMTLIDGAEATNGWSGGTAYSGFQRQGSSCLGTQASSGTAHLIYTLGTAIDLSNHTIFVWLRSGNPTTQSTGGFRIVLGDGTNQIAYYVGGSDNYGFFYNGWSCYKLNTANPPTGFEALSGNEASLNTASITEVGGGWNYASKANGNADNVFIDVMRYVPNVTPALVIGGGTSGDRGNFEQIALEDNSNTNAWGVVSSLVSGSKAYRINFGIDFGDNATGDSYFSESNAQVFITGESMTVGSMNIALLTNTTGINSFILNNITLVNIGTRSNLDVSSNDLDVMQLSSVQFSDFGTITSPTVQSANRYVRNSIFNNCGLITPNALEFTGCTFADALGDAITVSNSATFDVTQSEFINPTNSGVEITVADTYEFNGLAFSETDGVANYDVENTTAGTVTINASGGSNPTHINNSGGGTTTINNNVNVTLTGLETNTEVRVYNANTTAEIAGQEDITGGSFSFSTGAGTLVDIRIFAIPYEPVSLTDFEVPTADSTIPVEQRFDRNYENP